MFWFKKKEICEHDYHELETRRDTEYFYAGSTVDSEQYENTYIYCPKCDKRKVARSADWKLIKKAQEIKRSYVTNVQ